MRGAYEKRKLYLSSRSSPKLVVRILDEKTDAFALGSIGITIKAFVARANAATTGERC
jgi:hypothetical protein